MFTSAECGNTSSPSRLDGSITYRNQIDLATIVLYIISSITDPEIIVLKVMERANAL